MHAQMKLNKNFKKPKKKTEITYADYKISSRRVQTLVIGLGKAMTGNDHPIQITVYDHVNIKLCAYARLCGKHKTLKVLAYADTMSVGAFVCDIEARLQRLQLFGQQHCGEGAFDYLQEFILAGRG